MGKGDKKSKRGKIILGSYGITRPRKKVKHPPVDSSGEQKATKKATSKESSAASAKDSKTSKTAKAVKADKAAKVSKAKSTKKEKEDITKAEVAPESSADTTPAAEETKEAENPGKG